MLEFFLCKFLIICGIADGEWTLITLLEFHVNIWLKYRINNNIDVFAFEELYRELMWKWEINDLLIVYANC